MARYIPANASDEAGTYAYDIPDVSGYQWNPARAETEFEQGRTGSWTQTGDFDPSTLIKGDRDKYGRLNTLPRDDLTKGEKLAYILNYGEGAGQGLNLNDPELGKNESGAFGYDENYGNQNYWNMSQAEEMAERERRARYVASTRPSGFESGFHDFMSDYGYMIPLAMIGAGAATGAFGAAGAAAGGAEAAAGGFVPAAGSGASFSVIPSATYGVGTAGAAGSLGGLTAANVPSLGGGLALEGATLAGAAPSTYGSIVAPSLASGLGVGTGGVLGAGALSAEAVATLEAMNAGTGYGLNASQVPSLAGNLGNLAIPEGLTGAEALKYANQARQAASYGNKLSKLLGGTTGGSTPKLPTGTNPYGNMLGGNSFIGQIKGNQNPFIFNPQGQTVAQAGTYDVSGMANALRKS